MEEKDLRLDIECDMLETPKSDKLNFLNIVITGNETWVYGYDPKTKMQPTQRKHPSSSRPKKGQQVSSNVKLLQTVIFVSYRVV